MFHTRYFEDVYSNDSTNVITGSHFGVNFLSGYNQTSIEGNFENIVQDLGAASIRYPGGTVTERYFDPNGPVWQDLFENDQDSSTADDGRVIEGPGRIFEFATRNDLEVTFVLPTESLVEMVDGRPVIDDAAVEKVHQLVGDILGGRYGEVRIDVFEIGNEYYAYPDMSAREYAAIANELIIQVDDAIQDYVTDNGPPDNWVAPDIAVQAGAGWQEGDNAAIIEGLSPEALEAVSSVVTHYYAGNLEDVPLRDRNLGQIDDWEDATGIADLNYYISEWNVSGEDTGMAQASTMLSAFDEMLSQGVDSSTMWGTQLRFLSSGLSVNIGSDDLDDTDSRLSIGGEMIASMSESLRGLQAIETDADSFVEVLDENNGVVAEESGDFLVNVYGNTERAVIYISSRSGEELDLDLNLGDYFGDFSHAWGETLTSRDDPNTGWRDESDPLSAYGVADFDGVTTYQINGETPITLEPYEIVRISVQLNDVGVTMQDHDPLIQSDLNYDDNLVGSQSGDTIVAHIGEDSVLGRGGDDILLGGDDNDAVFGGAENDALFGEGGDDFVRGDGGDDWVVGGAGNDRLVGNSGNDIISGNSGDDILIGGEGDDILSGSNGNNTIFGGGGSDYIVVTPESNVVVEDFNAAEGDQITFLGQFRDVEQFLEQISTTESIGDEPGDLIVTALDGTTTTFAGAAEQQEEILNSVVDFTDIGEATLDLADQLNQMSEGEIEVLIDSMGTEEFEASIGFADGVLLFANLEADASANLLNSLDPDELDEFLSGMADDGLKLALGEMTPEEMYMFLDSVSDSVALTLVEDLGEETIGGSLLGLNPINQIAVSEKFFPSQPVVDQNLSGNGRPSDDHEPDEDLPTSQDTDVDDSPIIPHYDPDPNASNEIDGDNDDDDYISADCFVATVAYEDSEHPDVWLLRWYRDTIMRRSILGRLAIVMYWYLGPRLAEWVAQRPRTKGLIKQGIEYIVRFISFCYAREPGRQFDQPNLSDSRKIRVGRLR